MTDEAVAIAVRPGEGETIQGPVGGPIDFKVRAAQTGGRMTAFENTIAPNAGPPLHTHAVEDETWHVLEGTLRFQLGAETSEAPAGTFVYVPRGVPHAFRNVGEGTARVLVQFTPSGEMEGFFERMAAMTPEEIEPATFGALGAAAGMEITGPPLGGD
jgi:quercetin dioxygenase-like cupin family protein